MKTKKNILGLLGLVAIVALGSSCSSPTVKTNFAPGSYTLGVGEQRTNTSPAIVVFSGSTIDGKSLPENSVRAQELKKGIGDFIFLLSNSGLFDSVSVGEREEGSIEEGIIIEVSYDEEEDTHSAGAFGKGFASGFFTLGAAPITFEYSYSSKMRIVVIQNGTEILSNTSAKSADASGSHRTGEPMPERTITRKFITDENNKASVDFLVRHYHLIAKQ